MEDFHVMERFKASYNLNEYFPNDILRNVLLLFLMSSDLLKQVTIVWVFHHDAKKSDELNKNINETYHKLLLGSSIKASLYEEMFGCRTLARILTSFKAFSFSLSESLTILTFLRAYISWSASLFTWYTDEYAPSPKQYFTIRSRMVAASH